MVVLDSHCFCGFSCLRNLQWTLGLMGILWSRLQEVLTWLKNSQDKTTDSCAVSAAWEVVWEAPSGELCCHMPEIAAHGSTGNSGWDLGFRELQCSTSRGHDCLAKGRFCLSMNADYYTWKIRHLLKINLIVSFRAKGLFGRKQGRKEGVYWIHDEGQSEWEERRQPGKDLVWRFGIYFIFLPSEKGQGHEKQGDGK